MRISRCLTGRWLLLLFFVILWTACRPAPAGQQAVGLSSASPVSQTTSPTTSLPDPTSTASPTGTQTPLPAPPATATRPSPSATQKSPPTFTVSPTVSPTVLSPTPEMAVITVTNRMHLTMVFSLHGPVTRNFTVEPHSKRQITIPAGRYYYTLQVKGYPLVRRWVEFKPGKQTWLLSNKP